MHSLHTAHTVGYNLTYSNLPPYLHHSLPWWFCKSSHQVLLENFEWFISLYILYIGWMFHKTTKSLKSNNKVKKKILVLPSTEGLYEKKVFTVGIKSLSKWGSGTAWGPLAWSSFPSTYNTVHLIVCWNVNVWIFEWTVADIFIKVAPIDIFMWTITRRERSPDSSQIPSALRSPF